MSVQQRPRRETSLLQPRARRCGVPLRRAEPAPCVLIRPRAPQRTPPSALTPLPLQTGQPGSRGPPLHALDGLLRRCGRLVRPLPCRQSAALMPASRSPGQGMFWRARRIAGSSHTAAADVICCWTPVACSNLVPAYSSMRTHPPCCGTAGSLLTASPMHASGSVESQ